MLNAEMCNRRNKPIFHGTIFLALVAGLGYTFYLYKLTKIDLDISRAEADKHLKQQESLSSQLQVVYEHRARLERSLQKEKTDHKSTKLEFSKKQNDFLLNITRSKHEAMNRFNSLETQYNMLKAQSKELDTDYGRLQQTYSRLSAEHASVTNQQKRNFQLFKEQKANEISSLEEEIRTLKQQVVSLRTNLRSKSDEVEQYKHSSSRAVAASQQYQEKLKDLQGQLSRYQERLSSYVSRSKTSHRDVKLDKKREQGQESKLQDALSPTTIKSKDGQEGQHKETENPTVPFRNDSRLHHDRSRREVNEQVALPSDNDADIADMRKSPDENVYEQRKVKEGYTAEESYDSMKNIPLKDSNVNYGAHQAGHGVKVVSPGDGNAMNKWADILKQAAEQSRREGNVGVSKELAGETELGKSRLDDYRKQETVAAGDNDQRQLGEEEVKDKQDGEPVVNQYSDADRMQAGKPVVKGGQTDGRSIQTDHVADRPGEQGDQQKNDHVVQAGHVADRPGEQEDQEGEEEQEEEGEEEDLKEDGAADISRDSINSQVAEMRENHQQQQEKQRGQLEGAQVQQHVAPIQAVQRQAEEQRTQGAELAQSYQHMAPIQAVQRQAEEQRTQGAELAQSYQHMAPIQAVQRQAEEQGTQRADLAQIQQHVAPIQAVQRQQEEHKAQQADADDEDAGDDGNEQEADPDEKDPDDAGEKEEEEEDQNSRQHQVHYGDRTLKGANKQ